MKIRKPFVGIIAFVVVLMTMPLGHAVMIIMEKVLGQDYLYHVAIILGFIGLALLIWGMTTRNNSKATLLGLFSSLLVWTGWVEFAFVFFANKLQVPPLMKAGEEVTKPEYLIMPSTIGFWAIFMIYYFFGTKTGCTFFTWFQVRLKIAKPHKIAPAIRNVAMTTFMEMTMILWTFYLLLLFIYDDAFGGDRSLLTHIIAYGSLFWSVLLFKNLLQKTNMGYALRYAIPTVIIFWNFIEILGRWNVFKEIWVHPFEYATEMIAIALIVFVLSFIIYFEQKKRHKTHNN